MKASVAPDAARDASVGGRYRPVVAGLLAVGILSLIGFLSTYLVLEFKTGLRAYATAESVWARGVQDAIFHLDRFAETGDPGALEKGRAGLMVPLQSREGREQMLASPRDRVAARRAFENAGHYHADIVYLKRTLQYFGGSVHFERAFGIWADAEDYVFRLQQLMDLLEGGDVSAFRRSEIRSEIKQIREALEPMEREFAGELAATDHLANRIALGTVASVLLLSGSVAMWFLMWGRRRLAASEQEMRATLEHAGIGMAVLSPAGVIKSANGEFGDVLGTACDHLPGLTLEQVLVDTDPPVPLSEVHAAVGPGGRRFEQETKRLGPDGALQYLRVQVTAVPDARGRTLDYIVVVEDVTDKHHREDQLRHAADHDPLTGLLNRRGFLEGLERALVSAGESGTSHVLCFVDLDHFKALNDTHGHRAGDASLVALAELLRKHTRKRDLLARLGGDEFALILEDCSIADGEQIAEGVRLAVQELHLPWQGHGLQMTVSIGVVAIDTAASMNRVVEASDRACYRAKQEGRNRVNLIRLDTASGH